ncbi:MAG TPA: EAL domain-containing protein [Thermoanaerobaculia bacterium]|nr:EAL domain-containing protein [Thermoanaerobaculia bacterium]
MTDPILSSTSYAATGLSIATGVTAAVVLAAGLLVFGRSRRSAPAVLFLLVEALAASWLLALALTYAAPDERTALWWGRGAQLPMALLPAAVLHLAMVVARSWRKGRGAVLGAWIVAGGAGLVAAASPLVIRAVARRPWGFHPLGGAGVVATVIVSAVIYGAAVFVLWHAFRRGDGRASNRAGLLLVALILGASGFLDVLPLLGIEVYPVGYMAAIIFAVMGAAAVGQYRLVDLTPQYAAGQILETMKSAVILVDMEGTIRVVNRAATLLLGYAGGDLIGEPMKKIFDPEESSSSRRIVKSTGVLEQLMGWRSATGARIDVLTSSSFVRGADGAPVGVVYVASDYTERKRAEQALRESEQRYRKLFDANPLPMWVYDFESLRFVAVNDAAVNHYGYTREEFLRMKITDIRPQEDVPQILALLPLLAERGGPSTFRHMKKDGTIIHVEISSFEFHLDNARMRLVIAHDVTERRLAEQRLRESEARYRLLFERNLAGVYRTSVDGRVLDCNEAFARIFGYASREEMLRLSAPSLYFDLADREQVIALLREQKSITNHEARMRRKDDRAVWVLENMTLLDAETGEPRVIEGTVIDITERKYAQEQVEYQAYHDALTGLPNRILFRDRLNLALAHARRHSLVAAVMFLDLDEFKVVNDTLGHTVGDRLLQAIAARLVGAVRAEDTVARVGGDEFTILLPDVGDGRGASTVARKILEAVAASVKVDVHRLQVTPSLGVALFPGDGFDAETLLRSADRAMYRAKQLGRNNYQYATPPPFDDRFSLQRRLSEALEKGEFVLHYQPIVAVSSGAITAVEALLRWNDPDRGLQLPESFIAAADEADLMVPLGEWVLRTACPQLRRWRDEGAADLRLAVNLSPRQFHQPGLPEFVTRVLREAGLPPAALELEITEAAVMREAEQSLLTMRALHDAGVRIAIDDFGTGYSSFRYLRRLPIDAVKIDREFVRSAGSDMADRAAIAAVISMARPLGLRVVAEGVESAEELEFLRQQGCAEMQGFLHSRPLPAGEIEPVLMAAPWPGRSPPLGADT